MTESFGSRESVYSEIDLLATWTDWLPFSEGARAIDRLPGVYSMRTDDGIVYVGMAGERAGNGSRMPSGMRGRLSRYTSGRAAASGFGEAALDRALTDVSFLNHQLTALSRGEPRRVTEWAKDAIEWHEVELRWTVCEDGVSAKRLEDRIVQLLRPYGIWNR